MAAVVVAQLSELRVGVGAEARVAGHELAVFRLADGSVVVMDGICLHVGGPLAEGELEDGCVVCPWHGWTYDLATGRRRTALGDVPGVRSYRAWVEGDAVWAELPTPAGGPVVGPPTPAGGPVVGPPTPAGGAGLPC